MAKRELFHFHASHFNEKVRWALDLKDVPHERIALLPGPHLLTVRRLTGGTEVPVLREDDRVVAGSAQILAHLEEVFPEPPLLPLDPAERAEALAIQSRFDDDVGPAVRLAMFFDVMDADFAVGAFGPDRGPWARAAYRAAFGPISRVMQKRMRITAENAEVARRTTRDALEFVAERSAGSGYLVGERFTVADLAGAALLMPTVPVDEWGGPEVPGTDRVRRWLGRWSDHPGTDWVRRIYRQHRRPGPGA